jgi:hypothetical protein
LPPKGPSAEGVDDVERDRHRGIGAAPVRRDNRQRVERARDLAEAGLRWGRVELLERGAERVVRRIAAGGRLPGSRAVAKLLMRRERRALERLAGTGGRAAARHRRVLGERALRATGLVPRAGEVLVRSFVPGEALHRCRELPLDFFERLDELVRSLHARGVAHNDLHKEQNVLVGEDGWPWLVDFQLASSHALDSRTLRVRAHDDLAPCRQAPPPLLALRARRRPALRSGRGLARRSRRALRSVQPRRSCGARLPSRSTTSSRANCCGAATASRAARRRRMAVLERAARAAAVTRASYSTSSR